MNNPHELNIQDKAKQEVSRRRKRDRPGKEEPEHKEEETLKQDPKQKHEILTKLNLPLKRT